VPRTLTHSAAVVALFLAIARVGAHPVEQFTADPTHATVPPHPARTPANATEPLQPANECLLEQKLAELNRLQGEVERLRATTGTPHQILVKVQVLEISRTKLRRLGVDWAYEVDRKGDGNIGVERSSPFEDIGESRVIDRSAAFQSLVTALTRNHVAKVLADPSIITLVGRPASFHVGGELPLPSQPGGSKNVQLQSFGTKLDVIAIARGNNKTRLELHVRHSEPDYSHAVVIDGNRVPGVNIREIETALELTLGETALLKGLVQLRETVLISESGQKTETEEVETWFIVTPEVVPAVASSPATVR
jgi:Flp pilus assembly secretin CpaC